MGGHGFDNIGHDKYLCFKVHILVREALGIAGAIQMLMMLVFKWLMKQS